MKLFKKSNRIPSTIKLIQILLVPFVFLGCVGPLVMHETARTVGRTNHEFAGGLGSQGYVLKWNYGLTKDLDIGIHWESLSLGLRAKYSFKNQSHGWSFAGAAGLGSSFGGQHSYADIIASYKNKKWEPYGAIRIVKVSIDPIEFNDENGDEWFKTTRSDFLYNQLILGSRYWFENKFYLSAELSTVGSLTDDVSFEDGALASANLGYIF